jgi:pyruvate kinase
LISLGVSGVRLTFSYGTPALQAERARAVKAAAKTAGARCLTIADLPGEKVRLGEFGEVDSVLVEAGQSSEIVAAQQENPATTGRIPLPNKIFVAGLRVGETLVIGDGSAVGRVEKTSDSGAVVCWERAGVINQRRGVTLRGTSFIPRCLTDQDIEGLRFVAESTDFDMVALSFVSAPEDVLTARSMMAEHGTPIPIIAKIETPAGMDRLGEIYSAADIVMAARGDLALCAEWYELPGYVNLIAQTASEAGKPWILATQIAEGLEYFAMPTRAEICDLAHWLEAGCAAAMLSYETVFGSNAVGAVTCTKTLLDRWGHQSL